MESPHLEVDLFPVGIDLVDQEALVTADEIELVLSQEVGLDLHCQSQGAVLIPGKMRRL